MSFEQSMHDLLLAAVVSAALCAPAFAQERPLGSNLQGLLEVARAQSPELAVMRQEADAATQRV